MNRRQIYVSSGAFNSRRLSEALEEAEKCDARFIELSSSFDPEPDILNLVRAARSRFVFLVHNYFPPPVEPFVLNLAAKDGDVLRKSRELCRDALRLSAELGAPFYAAHAGFNAAPKVSDLGRPISGGTAQERSEALDIFQDSVGELVNLAQSLNIGFCVENNVVAPFNAKGGANPWLLLAEPDELAAFAQAINSPHFGYLVDVGHLKVTAQTLGFDAGQALLRLAPWIKGFHLSDNDGKTDSNLPFDETAWFIPWIDRFPETPTVIEAYRLAPEKLRQCLAALGAERGV